MSKKNRIKSPKQRVFASPGSLNYIGREITDAAEIKRIEYNASFIDEKIIKKVENCYLTPNEERVIWLDVDGVHEPKIIEIIGTQYGLHPLLLEDILNTTQKAKLELFEDENQLFVVLKHLHFDAERLEIESEQVSIILGENFLISFQEYDNTDTFQEIHKRIHLPTSRTRKFKADYLMYVLIDLVVDNYYVVLEEIAEKLEELEEHILSNPRTEHQLNLYTLKREMTFMRKAILPLRDIIGTLIREDSILVSNKINVYLRDVLDHATQTLETLETYRDVADNIMANYQAAMGNKMNQVMKTLTIFTAIFMPLSFIAGLYGMNFKHIPELDHPNGYYYTLAGMATISIGLWIYFKWKKYI